MSLVDGLNVGLNIEQQCLIHRGKKSWLSVRDMEQRDAFDVEQVNEFVVIDASRNVIYSSRRTGRFLELPAGAAQLGLIDLAKPALRAVLRQLIVAAPGETGKAQLRLFDGISDDKPTSFIMPIE